MRERLEPEHPVISARTTLTHALAQPYFPQIGTDVVEIWFGSRAGHKGIKAARAQYDAWLAIAGAADWKTPGDVKKTHLKASVLKGGRVVFNIKANDFRLIALVQYVHGVLMIWFSDRMRNMTSLTRRQCDENNLDRDSEYNRPC
jgi:mRNA interferase HigB